MPPSLPLELVLLILEGDFGYSKSTLSAAALVCSRWKPISQRVLFKKLTIWSPRKEETLSNHSQPLLQRLLRAPHLLRYVREVSIVDESWRDDDRGSHDDSRLGLSFRNLMTSDHEICAARAYFWLRDDPLIAKGLRALSHMARIGKFSFIRHGEAAWPFEETVSPATIQVIVAICRSPRLESLTLEGVPIELARCVSPMLRHLSVGRCIVGESEHVYEEATRAPQAQLRALTVNASSSDHFTREVDWLVRIPETLNQLKALRVRLEGRALARHYYRTYNDAAERLLLACHTLKFLELNLSFDGARKPHGISGTKLQYLEELRISFCTSSQESFTVPWIVDFLTTIPEENMLRVLELNIDLLQFLDDDGWGILDDLLADRKRLPGLKGLRVNIMMGRTQWVYSTDGGSGVHLPSPKDGGLIKIRDAMEWTKGHWASYTKMH